MAWCHGRWPLGWPRLPPSPSLPHSSQSPLLAYGVSEWLLGSAVHHQPPAGPECHSTSRSVAAYGRKAVTSSLVQHCIITKRTGRGVITQTQMSNSCWHKIKWFSQLRWVVFTHEYQHPEQRKASHMHSCTVCSLICGWFVGSRLWREESPSKDLYNEDQWSPRNSEWPCFGSSSCSRPLGQQLLRWDQTFGKKIGKSTSSLEEDREHWRSGVTVFIIKRQHSRLHRFRRLICNFL